MDTIYSEDEKEQNSIWSFLVPLRAEVLLFAIYALVLLAVINYRALFQIILNGSGVENFDSLVFSDRFTVAVYQAYQGLGTLAVLMFWALVGGIIFSLGWFFHSMTVSVKNDIEATKELTTNREKFAHSAVAKYISLFFSVVGIFVYVFTLLNMLLPLFSRLAFAWYGKSGNFLWMLLPLSIIGLAISLYTLHLLLRIISYTLRTITPQE